VAGASEHEPDRRPRGALRNANHELRAWSTAEVMERSSASAPVGSAWLPANRSGIAAIGLLAVVGWLVHPVLRPVHVEGFSASIESLAIHLSQGSLADYDALHPANLEFFALSRLGTVTFVASLIRWLGFSSEWAMRTTMWVGFVGLVWASIVLVRRWTDASVMLVIVTLLLIPGVSESAFFYNDNVLSAALALGALAVVGSSEALAWTALAGLLFGAGVVARLDAVLLAPAVGLIGYQQHGLGGTFVRRGLVFTGAALLPVTIVPATVDATILDVVRISNYAVGLWNLPPSLGPHGREFAFFIGTPAALLVAFGLLKLVQERQWLRFGLLAGVPIFFNLVALGKIWQSRQLLPMTPFFAAIAILGWQYLGDDRSRRRLRLVVVAVSVVVLFGPFARVKTSDGPRATYGRFWSPPLWTRWQEAIRSNMGEVRHLVSGFRGAEPIAVLTDTWDADRFLHLQLQRAGFVVNDIAVAHPACEPTAEWFVKGNTRVAHLRLHQPFLSTWRWFAAQRLQRLAVPCLAQLHPSQTFLVAPGARALTVLRTAPWLRGQLDADAFAAAYQSTGYDKLVALALVPTDIGPLAAGYATDTAPTRAAIADPATELARVEQMMANQVWGVGGRR
jgi:hypothetical protein